MVKVTLNQQIRIVTLMAALLSPNESTVQTRAMLSNGIYGVTEHASISVNVSGGGGTGGSLSDPARFFG